MIKLGITGGIGSGKSLVCRILQAMSIPVYDCDHRAKALYDTDTELKEEIITLFGTELYDTAEGKINRTRLAEIIFQDASKLAEINALVHPRVRADIDAWYQGQENLDHKVVAIESAILFASEGLSSRIDYSIAVLAPEALRIERAMARDKSLAEEIQRRMQAQMTEAELQARANFVITNDGIEPILPQIEQIFTHLSLH